MITIIFNENGKVISDFQLENWAKNLIKKHNTLGVIKECVACGTMVQILRIFIKRGCITPSEIEFFTEDGVYVGPDKNGDLIWPKGFCDAMDLILDELIGLI